MAVAVMSSVSGLHSMLMEPILMGHALGQFEDEELEHRELGSLLVSKDGIRLTESVHNDKELLTYTDGDVPLTKIDLDVIYKSKSCELAMAEGYTNGNDDKKLKSANPRN